WNGYKLHISETCTSAPEKARTHPNLITNTATTHSTVPDSKTLNAIHHALQQRGLIPDEHCLDSGYATAELIHGSVKTYGIALITPVLLDTSRQTKAQAGFAATDFTIDWEAEKATCPAGHTSTTWNPVVSEGIPKTVVSFAALHCIPCPFKPQRTTAKKNRRQLSLHPRQMTEALRHTRTQQKTKDWNTDYALRSGIEGVRSTLRCERTVHRSSLARQPLATRVPPATTPSPPPPESGHPTPRRSSNQPPVSNHADQSSLQKSCTQSRR
ncbi:transposase, partial [Streptomyces sp. NPDC059679]|uniref:transposase n=1 Tax=Streptomyces sp. NPDC059679 TaxID=3346903 RepID=UPI0036AB63FA